MEKLTIRLTDAQKAIMKQNAEALGMTLSTFIRYIGTRKIRR